MSRVLETQYSITYNNLRLSLLVEMMIVGDAKLRNCGMFSWLVCVFYWYDGFFILFCNRSMNTNVASSDTQKLFMWLLWFVSCEYHLIHSIIFLCYLLYYFVVIQNSIYSWYRQWWILRYVRKLCQNNWNSLYLCNLQYNPLMSLMEMILQ